MGFTEFLASHPVFTLEEATDFLAERGSRNRWTRKNLLAHHRKQGRILPVRRGLYCALPTGADPAKCAVDPYLVAAKMTEDAVLAYHTALEFHGRAYSVFGCYCFLSSRLPFATKFRGQTFRSVLFPKALREKRQENFDVQTAERAGLDVRVASLERTLVDVLDRGDLGGGWEEIWRSLESVEFFDLDKVIKYALLLGNATTVAKVGFFLEQHRETLMVEEAHLARLRKHVPRSRHYMERRGKTPCRSISGWNLVAPVEVVERAWMKTP